MSSKAPNKPHNTLAAERRKARHYGMQALYQWQMTADDIDSIEQQFKIHLGCYGNN